ncbi:sensor histidine kinase [Streptomyces indicus]|uniref:Two-component system, NarL family, sensor histidine kinase DesK n=1 Tax=Streptomyces indicus TaxID=417292 RepID=A0A1G9FXY3_9ACTN|nr:histidine kinase [Streptomyces indicus]SDK93254.1 two-component system, NarL family, sensor histidine kinase DesK [Streptomyces indicus]
MSERTEDIELPIGRPPTSRRVALSKMVWIGIWLVFLAAPVKDLADGRHTAAATALGWLGLAAFVGVYLSLVFRFTSRIGSWLVPGLSLLFLYGLGATLAYGLGDSWLGLFVYVSVAAGAVLPFRHARWAIPLVTVTMVLVGRRTEPVGEVVASLGLLTLMIGFAMCGVRQLVRTTIELREARATVAELAATQERLRLARDLHDLLGHSLSLITLKSELAGRMLPGHPEKAAEQVADIERVSRQALADVREAVTGYRRATLPGELAGARTALTAAGITATVPAAAPDLPAAAEEALAWALREAVTNVVRHADASRCTVDLVVRQGLDGRSCELVVENDGTGGASGTRGGGTPSGGTLGNGTPANGTRENGTRENGTRGNGLTGLAERLRAVGGTLDAGPVRKGFRLLARVPLDDREPPPAEENQATHGGT